MELKDNIEETQAQQILASATQCRKASATAMSILHFQSVIVGSLRATARSELEFVLPDDKVVRLHGTEWNETQRFYHYFEYFWLQWSAEMMTLPLIHFHQEADGRVWATIW